MKIVNAMMAVLFLTTLGASSCATHSATVVEHEEEITQEKNNNEFNRGTAKQTDYSQRRRLDFDHPYDY